MFSATALIDPDAVVGPVPPRLFGSFVEHMGRAIYDGLFEPGHPSADRDGLRQDVIELVRELGVSTVRYPGGNFVSGYHWEDGVGPRDKRPTRLDLAWHSIEPNTFGLDEFMTWIGQVQAEPMMAVNLGTRGVTEAVQLLEYTNHPGGTQLSDLRRANGRADPYGVKLWCLGNEMDGPWQIGHKSAWEYGRLAAETAKAMRMVDPTVELVACGSSHNQMPTFGSWERTVLEHAYEHVDYLSLHAYYRRNDDDLIGYLASADAMDEFIKGVVATCDQVAAERRHKRPMMLSFDEWNVEHRSFIPAEDHVGWTRAPHIAEDSYTPNDAVAVGNLLISLLRNSDRVSIACQAILVNVIAPIRTETGGSAWRQATYYPFALTARLARGNVLRVEPKSDTTLDSPTRGDVHPVDIIATMDGDGSYSVFIVNRSVQEAGTVNLRLRTDRSYRVAEHLVIAGEANEPTTKGHAEAPVSSDAHEVFEGQRVTLRVPAASWSMVRMVLVED